MDPDAALEEAQAASSRWRAEVESKEGGGDSEHEAAHRLAEAFESLDAWLSKGGSAPRAWRPDPSARPEDGTPSGQVFISADSLTTAQVRAAIAAHRKARLEDAAPTSLCSDSQRHVAEPHVGLNGPHCWSLMSQPLRPHQAAAVADAIARTA